jgi:two-component system, OmpR family, sensor kinase
MHESLRARLTLWYAGVLALVIVLFGGAVGYQAWRSSLASLDQELTVHARLVAAAVTPAGDGRFDVDLPAEAIEYFRQEETRPYYAIWTAAGELVDRSDESGSTDGPPATGSRTVSGRREVAVPASAGTTVVVGRDLSSHRSAAWSLAASIALAGLAALAVAVGGGWFLAGRALAPIRRISVVARAMVAGDLAARIPVERTESELEQVASALNQAFDRLGDALERQRRFTTDASHELRTPVSVMRAELDWALGRERGADEYRRSLEVCRRATARIEDTIESLLRTARAEAGSPSESHEPILLQSLAADVADSLGPLAQARGVAIELKGSDVQIAADPTLLREALSNVVVNAIQYNQPGGSVVIDVQREESSGLIEVRDTGIGIPEWAVPRVFDRFFRVDEARGRETGGAGLGLSVAHAIVTAHGGSVSCTSRMGVGSVFRISLPLAAEAASGH